MKAVTAYVLLPAILFAFALQSVDGAVLCWCGDGSVSIELACDDGGCCDAAHGEGQAVAGTNGSECHDCTDIHLAGMDVLARGMTARTKVTLDSLSSQPAPVAHQHQQCATRATLQPTTTPSSFSPQSTVILRV